MKKNGFSPSLIVDGGAHKGGWTKEVSSIFTESTFALVEPNPAVYNRIDAHLKKTKVNYKKFKQVLTATPGVFQLNMWEGDTAATGSSVCDHVNHQDEKKTVDVDAITLDELAKTMNQVPDLIKLDLQGYEIEALKGATECLKYTEVFLIEFSCLEAYIDRASITDLIVFMHKHEYDVYDIIDLHYRPYDGALIGGDFIFVKKNSALKKYKGWK